MELYLNINKEQLLKLIQSLTLLFISTSVFYFFFQPTSETDFNNHNYPSPNSKEIAMCGTLTATQANIEAKPHSGTLNTPVGNNINNLKKWSTNTSWNGNNKPTSADDVLIPEDAVIVLDQNIDVKSLTINGKLIVDLSKDISINTKYIVVSGETAYFEWGTETQPYTKKGIITLEGNNNTEKIPGTTIESKAILVEGGATLELHGSDKTSWTKLAANVTNGNTIEVSENTNWEAGDEILITSSRLNYNEAETFIITGVTNGSKTFTLNKAVKYPHIGKSKEYSRPTDGKTWKADMRAEVGLLSKSIKIQGDNSSQNNQFGGHIMIHMNGIAHVESVELFRMGQKSILGRYPFHWHLLQEKGKDQYLKNSSIHQTYNRAITIHGTESTLVENNFCYDHLGHGIFLEDGSERFNVIRGNVVALTKRPSSGEEITPSDNEMNEVQNRTPASFWITNPNNIFENNVAAGTHGTGFWFAMPRSPMGPSANIARFKNIQPYKEPLGKFSGNVAHSCKSGFDIFDQLRADHSIIRNAPWQRTDKRYMDNCTWYANELAVYGGIGGGRTYTEDVIFRNNIFLDNKYSVMHANYAIIDQSLFVANSGENVFNGERHLNKGYDGSCTIQNCHLVGWNASNANYVHNTGGANKHVNYRISGITKDHPGPPRMSFPDYSKPPKGEVGANHVAHPRFWSYVHWDIDGSLSGKANTSIITNHPLLRDGTEVRYENWNNLYRTDRRFAYVTLHYQNNANIKSTLVRTKAGTPKAGMYYINGFYGQFTQFPVMVNDGFLYTLQYESLPPGNYITVRYQDVYTKGDETLFRIKDFGKLSNPQLEGKTKYNSLAELKNANATGYAVVGNDFYFKIVSGTAPDISVKVKWSGSITLPKLDTDGDGKSDKDESIAGTDPIPNDPIPTNPVVIIPIEENKAPVVSFTAPVNNILEAGYSELYINVEASDADGDNVFVLLKIDGNEIRKESIAPYEWGHESSPDPSETLHLSVGNHTLEAIATDEKGASTSSTKTITVNRKNQAPFIEIISPSDGETFYLNEEIIITAKATDDVMIDKVNFKLNGAYHSQDRTTDDTEYSSVYLFTEPGTYELGARAFDEEGASTEVSISIEVNENLITGTSKVDSQEFYVYPHSDYSGIFIITKATEWVIYNSNGKFIKSGKGTEIDLSKENNAIYILKANNQTLKLIKF